MQNRILTLFSEIRFWEGFWHSQALIHWTILEKVGLGGMFLKLVKGILARAISKVHINGRFIEEIPISHGVRQGCPLSPLMDYLKHLLSIGAITRVRISKDLTICHMLFVDDVDIFIPVDETCFKWLQDALRIYELALGAKLNLEKSVIVPLALLSILQWLRDIGCTISQPGEILKYLGAPFGLQIRATNMYNFCLDRISKRISGWANRLLTFTRKVILIQHVLQSITTYHMMYSSAPTTIIQQIHQMCKDFLWGFDKDSGRQKTPLVAWKKQTQHRDRGGLGFIDYKAHAQALLRKWVFQALIDLTLEWARLFLALLEVFIWEQRCTINCAQHTPLDCVMLHLVRLCKSMETRQAFGRLGQL